MTARSTSWGGRRLSRSVATVLAAFTVLPVAGAMPAGAEVSPTVVVGPDAVAALRSIGARHVRTVGLDSAAVADLTDVQTRALRGRGLAVAPDAPVSLDGTGAAGSADSDGRRFSVRELTGAAQSNLDGSGVTVAVVDSGVDKVPGLAGRVVHGVDLTQSGNADRYGHGTFVAGLIAGNGVGANGVQTGIKGVAPAARIVSVKVADDRGRSSVGKLTLGLAWVLRNADAYGIDVVNLSLSTDRSASYDLSPVNALVEAAWFSDLVVVASAGNGNTRVTAAPGNDPYAITVGSVTDQNSLALTDDQRSPFSNYGATLDGFAKPEVASFGQHVRSTLPAGSTLAGTQKVTGLPRGYGQLSGTSMATGVASGVVALLEQARPELSPNQVKGALVAARRSTGVFALSRVLAEAGSASANRRLRPSIALATAYMRLVVGTNDPATIDWNSVVWTEVAWSDATWTDATWTNATWTNATWTDVTWAESTWTDRAWSTATWTSSTWTDATWTDATWTQATWSQ
jgi:serine protease AprX